MDTDPGGEYHPEILNSILLLELPASLLELSFGFIVLAVLLIGSAMISGAEVAYFSMDQNSLDEIDKDSKKGKKILNLLKKPKYLLATILVTNNFINVAIIMVSTYQIKQLIDEETMPNWLYIAISVVLVTFLLVLFGEVAPKVYAKSNNIKLASFMAGPLSLLGKITFPFSHYLVKSTAALEKRLSNHDEDTRVSIEEIDQAIELTVKDTKNANQEIELLKSIVKFGNVPVKQIMCARVDIVALDMDDTFADVLKLVREYGYSRIPVYEENFDKVTGFLYAKDLLGHLEKGQNYEWQKLIRMPAFFIPENKKIDDLLKEFQEKRIHVAIVVDEYGGTAGLVTLEDVLEEIIGEIKDEFDDHIEVEYKKLNDYNFLFEGKSMINDVCRLIGIETSTFEEVRGDSDSLAGLLLETLGRLPKLDEEIHIENYQFKVVSVDARRIRQVKITLPDTIIK